MVIERETRKVSFADYRKEGWVVKLGHRQVTLGSSSANVRLIGELTVR